MYVTGKQVVVLSKPQGLFNRSTSGL